MLLVIAIAFAVWLFYYLQRFIVYDKDFNVNNTLKSLPADMGKKATGAPGIAFHDNFVALAKA